MEEKQLTFKEEEITRMLNRAFDLFREGRFGDAGTELERALQIDFDYPDVASSLKCANLWHDNVRRLSHADGPYERGELLMGQWRHFTGFLDRIGGTSEKGLYSIRHFVFSTALQNYTALASADNDERDSTSDAELFFRIGRCHKELGSYDRAIEFLEEANRLRSADPQIMAELADCYALVGEVRAAKVFFREAFFVMPEKVDLTSLESALIRRLIAYVSELPLPREEVSYWIPVYGTLRGVFSIRRELRPLEYGRLKQSIYQMEQKLEPGEEPSGPLVPRLLNHYFWLIDHYTGSGEERHHVDEVLEKIRRVNTAIYHEYIH